MKLFNKLYLFVFATVMWSCSDLTELNENENAVQEPVVGNFIPSAVFPVADALVNVTTTQIAQFTVNAGNAAPNFLFRGEDEWNALYTAIGNLNVMIENSQEEGFESYLGVAYILKAYYGATISDLWVAAPFSEAGNGIEGTIAPVYDSQTAMYEQALALLEQANDLLALEESLFQGGDVVFEEDVIKWRKLANSLSLRYLLKLSSVTSFDSEAEITKILGDPEQYPIMESAEDDAVYDFTGTSPSVTSVTAAAQVADLTLLSEPLSNVWKQTILDPRIDFFFSLPVDEEITEHMGATPGEAGASIQEQVSNLSVIFVEDRGLLDFAIMTFSEVQFIKSELALSGLISEDAEILYNSAIEESITYWGLTLPEDYLTQSEIAWDGTLERLITQKWASFFMVNSIEAWSDFRRTGFPELVLPATVNSGEVPNRYLYPLSEQAVNATNYSAAVTQLGGDMITIPHIYQ